MTGLASSLVQWSALWKIVLAAFIAGGVVVTAFGVLLLSLQRSTEAGSWGIRVLYRAVTAVCGAFCIGAVAFGIYAMAEKPSAKPTPAPVEPPSALHRSAT